MTIWHIHSPTHPSNSDTINTQFLKSTVVLLLGNTQKTSYVRHQTAIFDTWNLSEKRSNFIFSACLQAQKSCQCTQQGYHCFTYIKNRQGNAHVNINTCRYSHTVVTESVQPKEKMKLVYNFFYITLELMFVYRQKRQ